MAIAPPATTVPANSAAGAVEDPSGGRDREGGHHPEHDRLDPEPADQPRRDRREQAEAQDRQRREDRGAGAGEREPGSDLGEHRADPGHRRPQVDRDHHHAEREQHRMPRPHYRRDEAGGQCGPVRFRVGRRRHPPSVPTGGSSGFTGQSYPRTPAAAVPNRATRGTRNSRYRTAQLAVPRPRNSRYRDAQLAGGGRAGRELRVRAP